MNLYASKEAELYTVLKQIKAKNHDIPTHEPTQLINNTFLSTKTMVKGTGWPDLSARVDSATRIVRSRSIYKTSNSDFVIS